MVAPSRRRARRRSLEGLLAAYAGRSEELARTISLENGSPITFSQLGQVGAIPSLVAGIPRRRPRPRVGGRHPGDARGDPRLARAGRRRGRHHRVERPADPHRGQARAGAAGRVQRGGEAGPRVTARRDGPGRARRRPRACPRAWSASCPAAPTSAATWWPTRSWTRWPSPGPPRWAARSPSVCGQQLKRTSLELGGKSAAIVLDDADVDRTAGGLRFASFMNNGQACAAQTRVLAPAVALRRGRRRARGAGAHVRGRRPARPRHGDRPAREPSPAGARAGLRRRSGSDEGARLVVQGDGRPGRRVLRGAHPVRRRGQPACASPRRRSSGRCWW